MADIFFPVSAEEINQVRLLMIEYATSFGRDLRYQHFDNELADLPGKYAPPSGYLLLAKEDGHAAGCVAVRRIDERTCEMKRLFVSPAFRRRGIGRALVTEILRRAAELKYSLIKLDTMTTMREAISLYKSLGFAETQAYTYNPSENVVYLERSLKPNAARPTTVHITVRIAVASSDGKVVNQHFGAAHQFVILDVGVDAFSFVETRLNAPPCRQGEHDDGLLLNAVRLLSDCRLVLAVKAGPGARYYLGLQGIDVIEYGGFIEDALSKLRESADFRKLNKRTDLSEQNEEPSELPVDGI